MSFQYFSIKYEIVSGSLLSFFSLCKESKKREAIKKRKPGNVASTASKQGSSAAVLLKLVHKKSLTQCLKEMLASKQNGRCNGYTNFDAVVVLLLKVKKKAPRSISNRINVKAVCKRLWMHFWQHNLQCTYNIPSLSTSFCRSAF